MKYLLVSIFFLSACVIEGPMGMALIPVNFGVDVLVPLDAGLEDFE